MVSCSRGSLPPGQLGAAGGASGQVTPTPTWMNGGDAPIDADTSYPDGTPRLYLTGKGTDDAVRWDFTINSGRQAGVLSTLPVPSNWELHGFGTLAYGFNPSTEVGTYRRSFELPADWAGKQVFIVFEGSMTDTTVSINGASAGPVHQGAFYRFKHDVTSLVRPGPNVIEVVVAEQSADASVNAAEREGDYWNFGGIFRPVYLEGYPQQSIDRVAIDARADGAFSVRVLLRNVAGGTLTGRIFDSKLEAVGEVMTTKVQGGATQATLTGAFPGVQTWSAEAPNRYRLAVELETDGGVRHAIRQNFGFRTVEVRAGDGIYVNGARTVMRGVNRHAAWPDSGRALSPRLSLSDAQLLKGMNINAVRSSHYPQDEHFLDRADAIGLYILDELAGWQTPPYDTGIGQKLIEEMVTFNVNHPSIIFWDNGNEGGWNTALDGEFARWDPQGRAVLHPWSNFSNVNTDHYETYASTTAILAGSDIFMPTEFLHALYDGGGGAGLDDYWAATLASPRGAGGFIWAFADEGVVRAPGQLDTAGNSAPDGILGPYRQKEGSYYTVRQIWSPVQIPLTELPPGFDGNLPVQNRYDSTDLSSVRFDWKLVTFDFHEADAGHTVLSKGTARTASIAPRATGMIPLRLPADRGGARALLLDAVDATGTNIGTWSWMLATPAEVRASIVPATSAGAAVATDDGVTLSVTAAGNTFTFARATGTLAGVTAGGKTFALKNGPTLSVGSATLATFTGAQNGTDYVLTAGYTGNLQQVVWRVRGDGWLSLSYTYNLQGEFDFFGVDFDCPLAQVTGTRWLGRGPTRVWKNRMRGPSHDVWQREKNLAIAGEQWDLPEFTGYFADVYWARLATNEGPIDIVMDSPGQFLRLYTPNLGSAPKLATATFPAHDISILHGISAIGDKFIPAADHGPQSAPHQVDGTFSATVYFHFGAPSR